MLELCADSLSFSGSVSGVYNWQQWCQLLMVGSGSLLVLIGGGCVWWHEQLQWWSHKTIGSYCKNSVFDMMATVSASWAMLVLFTCCIISLTTVYRTYVRISATCDRLLCFDSSFPGEDLPHFSQCLFQTRIFGDTWYRLFSDILILYSITTYYAVWKIMLCPLSCCCLLPVILPASKCRSVRIALKLPMKVDHMKLSTPPSLPQIASSGIWHADDFWSAAMASKVSAMQPLQCSNVVQVCLENGC